MDAIAIETKTEAARHVDGARIMLGNGIMFDCASPEGCAVEIEDYAYGLAYTVRFRGQTKVDGSHVFYGVGEHVTRGAEHLLVCGHGIADALAFLFHESGELPFGDLPGPAKNMFPGWRDHESRACAAINAQFDIDTPDCDLIKRFDIRMYLTEKRDLMPGGLAGKVITPGFEPFGGRIVPFAHPDMAAERFLRLYSFLTKQIARAA